MPNNLFNQMAVKAYDDEPLISKDFNQLLSKKRENISNVEYIRNNNSSITNIDARLKLNIEWLLELQELKSNYFIEQGVICIDVLSSYFNDLPKNTKVKDIKNLIDNGTIKSVKKGKVYSLFKEIEKTNTDIIYLVYIKKINEDIKETYSDFIYNDIAFFPLSSNRLISYIKDKNSLVHQNYKNKSIEKWNSAYITISLEDIIDKDLLHNVWYI